MLEDGLIAISHLPGHKMLLVASNRALQLFSCLALLAAAHSVDARGMAGWQFPLPRSFRQLLVDGGGQAYMAYASYLCWALYVDESPLLRRNAMMLLGRRLLSCSATHAHVPGAFIVNAAISARAQSAQADRQRATSLVERALHDRTVPPALIVLQGLPW
jgi:hypothetical protein